MTTASLSSSRLNPMHAASEKTLGKSHGATASRGAASAHLGAAERTVVQERLAAFLMGLYPTKTAENVGADTRISPNTVAKWLERGSAPSAWAMLRLLDAYGAELLCAVMKKPPAWAVGAAREQQRERLRAQIAELQSLIDGGK